MTESINTIVVGAGVIGLACARAIAASGREVIVIDPHAGIGQGTSSRNSEVIHAGIYYEPNSSKARLCVSGKQSLYEYCTARGVPHSRLGKLIVAPQQSDCERLRQLEGRAKQNGVDDLRWLDSEEIQVMEPELDAAAALLSPSTGIVDAHALMLALQADVEADGGYIALRSRLVEADTTAAGTLVTIESADESMQLKPQNIVNCAGLHASSVARLLHTSEAEIPITYFVKGVYFSYSGASPFSRLIYPLPEPGGLGIHATLDLAGTLRFGPDVEWIDEIDYSVDPGRSAAFTAAIRRWWPAVDSSKLAPAYAGIRPKLSAAGEAPADFQVKRTCDAGSCIVNLFGIESPGLTAALAIGDEVCGLIR